MNTRQQNILEMGHAVRAFLSSNEAVTNTIVAFPAAFTRYRAVLDEAESVAQAQAQRLSAIILERNRTLEAMRNATLALAGMALTYADEANEEGLAEKVQVSAGDFNRNRLFQQMRIAREVLDAIRPVQPQLAGHGVTAALVDDLEAKITAAEDALPTPRSLRSEKGAATEQLQLVIDRLNRVLQNQLDVLIRPLAKTQVAFYLGYRNARKIVNSPGVRRRDTSAAAPSETSPTSATDPLSKAA